MSLPSNRRVLYSLVTFALLFAGLNLPARGVGRALASLVSECANRAIGGPVLGSDLDVRFEPARLRARGAAASVDRAWTVVLRAERSPTRAHASVPINLRKALWLPLALFIALALASPIWQSARGPLVLLAGALAVTIPFTLVAAIHAAGVLYENYVIDLGDGAQAGVRFGSAWLAAPGLVYALPLLIWAALLYATRPRARGAEPLARLVSARSQ